MQTHKPKQELKKDGVLLEKTLHDFENEGVLNPAAIREGEKVHLFYRAVRKGNHSSIGYCRFDGPLQLEHRDEKPLLSPEFEYESHGIEDPRITRIDELYYLTYTAYDGVNALGALATSTDLKTFTKQGIIVPQFTFDEFKRLSECGGTVNTKYTRYNERQHHLPRSEKKVLVWDKNVIFFPRRINNKLYFLHRVRPDIQIASVTEISELTPDFWNSYFLRFNDHILIAPRHEHEASYVGGGCPPIETEQGWLLIYHGVHDTPKGYVYSACAALLDLEDPSKEIARLPYPLFTPEFDWELKGEVNNVCFPTGAVVFDSRLYIYYGAADERIACASINLPGLVNELLSNTRNHE